VGLEESAESKLEPNFVQRSKSDQVDEIPNNIMMDNKEVELQNSSKKKGKSKNLPKTIKRVFPNWTDATMWRKRNRLEKKTRIFKMIGNYHSIKKALYERGWVENKDKTSPCFDLLWTLRQRDIDYDNLRDGQIVNHFRYNGVITTKVGLCRNLSKVINFNNVDIDTFFPKWYALKDEGEWEAFEEHFKVLKAEWIVKRFLKGEQTDPDMLDVAMTVCRRNLLDLDEIIDNPYKWLVKDCEWKVLSQGEKKRGFKKKRDKKVSSLAPVRKNKINSSPNNNAKKGRLVKDMSYKSPSIVTLKLPEIENKQMFSTTKESKGFFVDSHIKDQVLNSMVDDRRILEPQEEEIDTERRIEQTKVAKRPVSSAHTNLLKDVRHIWDKLQNKFPQYAINGDKNIWIAKPAGLSRGRGIQVFSNLEDISAYTRGKDHNWILQKYIENPMIVNNRKFDLRIWVLVTDLNPLTIWFWNKPYVRFPAADYNDANLDDRFIHLTNNSVAKNLKESEIVGDGNMWFIEELQSYLIQKHGTDIWNEKIKPRWHEIVTYSLQAVQDMLDSRKGSMEMFGYDIMVDEQFNSWLIEVNSSPTMEYSTGVTKELAQKVMESVVKVISDYDGGSKQKKKQDVDTGEFELIYKGKKYAEKGLNLFGLNFCWEGRRIY
jgi:tubulin monoglycylase TTLL3/8